MTIASTAPPPTLLLSVPSEIWNGQVPLFRFSYEETLIVP